MKTAIAYRTKCSSLVEKLTKEVEKIEEDCDRKVRYLQNQIEQCKATSKFNIEVKKSRIQKYNETIESINEKAKKVKESLGEPVLTSLQCGEVV
jgi:signal transduction histidine kinase